MSKEQKEKTNSKILILSFCLIALAVISAIITVAVLNFNKYDELSSPKGNILYYSENEKHEQNEVLIVGISDKNETNTLNESGTNNNETNNIKKQEDIPYYVKVNYQENVVTVYKKDSARKLHCSNKSNALLMWRVYSAMHKISRYDL